MKTVNSLSSNSCYQLLQAKSSFKMPFVLNGLSEWPEKEGMLKKQTSSVSCGSMDKRFTEYGYL